MHPVERAEPPRPSAHIGKHPPALVEALQTRRLLVRAGHANTLARLEASGAAVWVGAVCVDLVIAVACVGLILEGPLWLAPFWLVALGNRQRALANLLHEAVHRIHPISERITRALLAPLLGIDLDAYRLTHGAHHRWTCQRSRDPEGHIGTARAGHAMRAWVIELGRPNSSLVPDRAAFARLLGIGVPLSLAGWSLGGGSVGLLGVLLWLIAGLTSFRAITALRNLCDHPGAPAPSLFDSTATTSVRGILGPIIHPHANGYHLDHHLLPSVPFHRLAAAHRLLSETRDYRRAGRPRSYFRGPDAIAHAWSEH